MEQFAFSVPSAKVLVNLVSQAFLQLVNNLEAAGLNEESWERDKPPSDRSHVHVCICMSYYIARRVPSHIAFAMLPDRPIEAATFAGGLGEDSWHLQKAWKSCSWLMVRCEVIYPKKNTVFPCYSKQIWWKIWVQNHGQSLNSTPWCAGCCPCPRVSRLAFKGSKLDQRIQQKIDSSNPQVSG